MKFLTPIMLATVFLATTATAQESPLTEVSVETLVEGLTPQPVIRFRGINVEQVADAPSVDLAIGFEYNSAELTEDARDTLMILAEALGSDDLEEYRFELAGHTDAVGSDAFNEALSVARAQAVAAYLVEQMGIPDGRLDVSGHGESRLLFPDLPEDGRNRRVEVRTVE